ncbi:MAG: bifunctional indole-3-glycerol-phosphate synthase TrpC/phosphoribosylanthranilate isomerase TrpF [Candidatus Peregrinibacteria bacterium]|nr:bifunctional indole-3-glycerol-phosphate synthase TrpC/phosphoribosylanthranilate isomerase TrpF [Candidatus Peregrinibacteria bacterium]MDZ4245375.1 bifunctional indole-3-glycerol-phosphate synthase TrpC/phosphoribosylanthranilate isomerase TrpF [Candidatus Gracilibacteria bacterium]
MKTILIIDNFDSFTFNLKEYFKRLGVRVLVYRNNITPQEVEELHPDAIVFSPGPSIPKKAGNMMKIIKKHHKNYPMLGVCLGHEAFIEFFGGSLKFVDPVHGESSEMAHDGKTIFKDLPQNFSAGRYHSLAGDKIPNCFEISATHEDIVMGIRHKSLPIEGVQFHPESVLTMKGECGLKILKNFIDTYLSEEQDLEAFLRKSVEGKLTVNQQEEFLKNKNDLTPQELAKAVEFLQTKSPTNLKISGAVDVCGTGGSGLCRINTSTISSFVLAASGVKIAKHGNKAASGRFGSFDLLEELGIPFDLSSSQTKRNYEKYNLCFLYARSFYPIMKQFAEVRNRIGGPTFFNIIGPLLSPAHVKKQIIGTTFKDKMELIAETCKLLERSHVLVVRGKDGLDEVTLTGKTDVVELKNGKITKYTITPEDFGLKKTSFKNIQGGNAKKNTEIALQIINNECTTPHKDLVLINAALTLKFLGKARTLKEGYRIAKKNLESGKAQRVFEQIKMPSILMEIIENKEKEVEVRKKKKSLKEIKENLKLSRRDFKKAIKKDGISLIAEIKKASPSMKLKNKLPKISALAKTYEQSGSSAISVLCDEKYFQGSLSDLKKAHKATEHTPLLCKDFIVDEYQIYEARQNGADAVLLIASVLNQKQIKKFLKITKSLKMDAICEVHNREELKKVLKTKAEIIGINNRNLHDFTINLETTNLLIPLIPKGKIIVSESGIKDEKAIEKLSERVNAILVGTSIVQAENVTEKIQQLISQPNKKIMLKICGVRTAGIAKACEELGVDMIGLNFVPTSKRKISQQVAKAICENMKNTKTVGIFQNQNIEEVNALAGKLNLDYIQLHGDESLSYIKKCTRPVIKAIKICQKSDMKKIQKYKGISTVLLDGPLPGSGIPFDQELLENINEAVFIAGGINGGNLKNILKHSHLRGIDIASGVETNGQIQIKKIKNILNQLKPCL